MGYSSYSSNHRHVRAVASGFATKSVDQIFTQSTERRAHKDMMPSGIIFRECLDSAEHPNTIPIQLYLDVTGSMGRIPHDMIKDGLPTLMGSLIQNGVKDASLMFGAVGDLPIKYKYDINGKRSKDSYSTPQEALEQGLLYTLKNLIQ